MTELRVLGTLDLIGPDRSLVTLAAQPKRVALLVYLTLARPHGFCRRDRLLALLWPDLDESRARNALSKALHHIRRELREDILISRGVDEVAVDRAALWCDALEFERALADRSLDAARDLYKGELLPGFHVADTPAFEAWLELERAWFKGEYAKALQRAAGEAERVGDMSRATQHWNELAALDPLNADAALRLIQALAATGDSAGALRHAREYASHLERELELPPDERITAFASRLRKTLTVAGHVSLASTQGATTVDPTTHPGVERDGPAARSDALREPAATLGTSPAPARRLRWRGIAAAATVTLAVAVGVGARQLALARAGASPPVVLDGTPNVSASRAGDSAIVEVIPVMESGDSAAARATALVAESVFEQLVAGGLSGLKVLRASDKRDSATLASGRTFLVVRTSVMSGRPGHFVIRASISDGGTGEDSWMSAPIDASTTALVLDSKVLADQAAAAALLRLDPETRNWATVIALVQRARLAAVLGQREKAVQLLGETVHIGGGFWRRLIHEVPELFRLRGYQPFDALINPVD